MNPKEHLDAVNAALKHIKADMAMMGFRAKLLDTIPKDLVCLERTHEYLKLLIHNEYKEWKKVRALLPEHIWERYDLLEITGLQEQDLLEQKRLAVKAKWLERPTLIGGDHEREKRRRQQAR